jgi:hypothetical protein
LYDSDFMTDIAAYDTSTGKFYLAPSSQNWNTTITRTFPASPDGGQPIPHAVPVPGMISGLHNGIAYQPRLGFALWWPDIGFWNVMWNPVSNDTRSACQWGAQGDVPIGGIGSDYRPKTFQTYSKMTVFRPNTSYSGPGALYFRNLDNLTCGATSGGTYSQTKPRSIVYQVRDMTGDGLPEIWVVNQDDAYSAMYFTSESGYATPVTVTLGSHLAVIL